MIPATCKRLAEVDFPIAEVSRHAVREKSIRHGHPSTLHLWWARRPLASSRAMLMALLLPDPCDSHCPLEFKIEARRILKMYPKPLGWTTDIESDLGLRKTVLSFIADFSNWDLAANKTYLDISRALVRAAHGEEPPLVVDPFAGGGSIPLEALRLGCEVFASDLNPVACLILKVMLEDVPRHGPGLAEELRKLGGEIKRQAELELADLYPTDADGAAPIAYLWARTVRCEAPNCGAEMPLMRSFWLCNKAKRKRALKPRVERPDGSSPRVHFSVFEPRAEKEVRGGTITRAKATCLCCGAVLPPDRVRAQLATQNGGADVVFDDEGSRLGGARMMAVVTVRSRQTGRHYRVPTDSDYAAVRKAQERVAATLNEWERGGRQGFCPVPDELIALTEIRRISVPIYGMRRWGDLFTARQKAALVELGRLVSERQYKLGHLSALSRLLGIAIDKTADLGNALAPWKPDAECPVHLLARQAIGMAWDFCESVPSCDSSGSFLSAYSRSADALQRMRGVFGSSGQVQCADAADHPLPDEAASVWFTDPPYYDAVPYAHLADFFYVWLKRSLAGSTLLAPGSTENGTTPKRREIVADRPHRLSSSKKDGTFYEKGMAATFAEGRRVLREDGVSSVVFAHKTTEGWEALLSGMIQGGWTITGSWPIATEMGSRLNARETASLSTSVHLVCRRRPEAAPVGDWADVLREVPQRVANWMERLQGEGIRGADLVFACVGPSLEIFSRYEAVETADGRPVELSEFLEKVWEVVGRSALEQVLGATEARASDELAGALEEDARLSALFLWTYQSTEPSDQNGQMDDKVEESVAKVAAKGYSLPFDVVRRFAQPMGIDLDAWTGRIVGQAKGVVRLLPVTERAKDLFGADGAGTAANWIESDPGGYVQQALFPDLDASAMARTHSGRGRSILDGDAELQAIDATTLDRLHAAMLLQANGHANALRTLIGAEQDRGPDFMRLANALSALYPRGSQEKRLLDAMLLAVPR